MIDIDAGLDTSCKRVAGRALGGKATPHLGDVDELTRSRIVLDKGTLVASAGGTEEVDEVKMILNKLQNFTDENGNHIWKETSSKRPDMQASGSGSSGKYYEAEPRGRTLVKGIKDPKTGLIFQLEVDACQFDVFSKGVHVKLPEAMEDMARTVEARGAGGFGTAPEMEMRFEVEEGDALLELAPAPASSLPSASAVTMRRAHAPTDATKTNDPISQFMVANKVSSSMSQEEFTDLVSERILDLMRDELEVERGPTRSWTDWRPGA